MQLHLNYKFLLSPVTTQQRKTASCTCDKTKNFSFKSVFSITARVNADDLQNNNSDSSSFLLFLPKIIKEYFTFTYIGNITTSIALYFTWEVRNKFDVFPGSSKRLRHVTECYWSKWSDWSHWEEMNKTRISKPSRNHQIIHFSVRYRDLKVKDFRL